MAAFVVGRFNEMWGYAIFNPALTPAELERVARAVDERVEDIVVYQKVEGAGFNFGIPRYTDWKQARSKIEGVLAGLGHKKTSRLTQRLAELRFRFGERLAGGKELPS